MCVFLGLTSEWCTHLPHHTLTLFVCVRARVHVCVRAHVCGILSNLYQQPKAEAYMRYVAENSSFLPDRTMFEGCWMVADRLLRRDDLA